MEQPGRCATTAILVGLLLVGLVPAVATAQERAADVTIIRPDGVTWTPGSAGYADAEFAWMFGDPRESEPFAFRMRMPADWAMPPHIHDTAEHITVLSGTLDMRFDRDGERIVLPAGSFVSIPAGTPMWAWTGSEPVILQVHGVGPFGTTPVE
jgi:quercetin dioxygenase-like cupin family protein